MMNATIPESASSNTIVVKMGGEVIASPTLAALAADIAAMTRAGTSVVVVHGGGPQATELQKKLGQTPHIVAGRRVTDEATLDVMKMVVGGKLNIDVCSALLRAGGEPVGLHGASAGVIRAVKRPPRVVAGAGDAPIDFGHVGDVVGVNASFLGILLRMGRVPVLACIGADDSGNIYNINADTVASKVATGLDAKALVLVSDVSGVLRDVNDPGTRIPRLTESEANVAIADGVITKGMIPKVEESFAAVRAGVRAVHIVGKIAPGDFAREIQSPGSVGTVLVAG